MLTEEEYRSYLDQPKHTLAKLKSIAQKIVGTVKADLAGKTRAEVIDHLLKYTSLDEEMNINLKSQTSLIGAVSNPKPRKPRSDKGMPRMKKTPKAEVMPKAKPVDDKKAKVSEVKRLAKGVSAIPAMIASMKPKPQKKSKKLMKIDLVEYNA